MTPKRYNKSKIMKLAHHMRKHEGYTLSIALKLAWIEAKRSEFYFILPVRKATKRKPINTECPIYQQMMHGYYNRGSNAYYGD